MILRIATEGQYQLAEVKRARLQELDTAAVAACEAGDADRFHTAFAQLLEFVRANGSPVASGELVTSDLILPPPDVSLEEASAEFSGEGLLPNV
jgi:hypothetical protein